MVNIRNWRWLARAVMLCLLSLPIAVLASCEEQTSVPPVSISGGREVIYVGDSVELTAEFEPAEGAEYAYDWAVTEGSASVSGASSAKASVTAEAAGRIEVRLRLADRSDLTLYRDASVSFKAMPRISKDSSTIDLSDVLPELVSLKYDQDGGQIEWRLVEDGLSEEYAAWLSANVSISGSRMSLASGANPPEDDWFEVQAYRGGEPIEGARLQIALRHTHTFAENFTRSATEHWHAATCGHSDITTIPEKHDYDDDYRCYTCQYRHEHSWGEWEPDPADPSSHVRRSLCGHLPAEKAEHALTAANGYVCPYCGYAHAHSFEQGWSHDGQNHWHAALCGHDVRYGEQAHSYGPDWTCQTCGYAHEHEFDESKWVSGSSTHWRKAVCGHLSVRGSEAEHNYDSGWDCLDCGYHHAHEWGGLENDAEGHWRRAVCHPDVTTAKEPHQLGADYVCAECGWGHEHSFSDSEWESGELTHWRPALCGHDVRSEEAAHDWGGWATTLQPTCVSDGERQRICQTCGRAEVETVQATGLHSWGEWQVTAAEGCVSAGEERKECSVCHASEVRARQALGHDWAVALSSDADGHWRECSRCDAVCDEAAHSFGDWQEEQAATCEQGGSEKQVCEDCGYVEHRATEALGHNWGAQQVLSAATCTQAGSWQQTCSRCQAVDGPHAAAALGHDWSEAWSSDGQKHWHACSRCDERGSEAAHSFGAWQTSVAATCEQAGGEVRSCSVCLLQEQQATQALGHDLAWQGDEDEHWQECRREGCDYATSKQAHSYDEDGLCSSCGRRDPSVPLPGVFTINSNGDKVRFSLGNLYWDGSAFGIEAYQYDYRTWGGSAAVASGAPAITSEGGTGLFNWSRIVERTYAESLDSAGDSATDTFALAKTPDHESAVEGFDILTKDEWAYLIGSSAVRSGKYGLATITGVNGTAGVPGLVLLPDSWALPAGCSFTSGSGGGWTTNTYSVAQWQSMETAGAVFLSAPGLRSGANVSSVGSYGGYWSATPKAGNASYAYDLIFGTGYVQTFSDGGRPYGQPIRMVERVHEHSFSSNWSSDDERHWHESACGHDVRADEGDHSFADGLCSVCGRRDPSAPLPGVFSVSASDKIRFSRGNLYHVGADAASGWGFEACQYDYRSWPTASNNAIIDGAHLQTPSGSTGMFYWTKGAAGSFAQSFTSEGSSAVDDVFFANSDASVIGSEWSCLSCDEWDYLLWYRSGAAQKQGHATLQVGNGIVGFVLLPDFWELPAGCSFESGCDDGWSTNTYGLSEWLLMEEAGAVFLPAAGSRSGSSVYPSGNGNYWTTSPSEDDPNCVWYVSFASGDIYTYDDSGRNAALSVRLVQRVGRFVSKEFTVDSSGGKVQFVGGNLYWNGSSFATENNQYDYRTWNSSIAVINGASATTSSGNTGLFYWSRIMDRTYVQSFVGTGDASSDTFALAKTSAHEAAIEGCDILTRNEWSYVIGTSAARNGKNGLATITGVNGTTGVPGLVLLPDSWTLPAGCSFTATKSNWTTNTYSAFEWFKMEQAGAVFLPAVGTRNGATANNAGSVGYYWSASPNASGASDLGFCSGYVGVNNSEERSYGRAVRLVQRI